MKKTIDKQDHILSVLLKPTMKTSLSMAAYALKKYKEYLVSYEKVSDRTTCDIYREEINLALEDLDKLQFLIDQLNLEVIK